MVRGKGFDQMSQETSQIRKGLRGATVYIAGDMPKADDSRKARCWSRVCSCPLRRSTRRLSRRCGNSCGEGRRKGGMEGFVCTSQAAIVLFWTEVPRVPMSMQARVGGGASLWGGCGLIWAGLGWPGQCVLSRAGEAQQAPQIHFPPCVAQMVLVHSLSASIRLYLSTGTLHAIAPASLKQEYRDVVIASSSDQKGFFSVLNEIRSSKHGFLVSFLTAFSISRILFTSFLLTIKSALIVLATLLNTASNQPEIEISTTAKMKYLALVSTAQKRALAPKHFQYDIRRLAR